MVLAKSAARRLDYDARVCPAEHMASSARQMDTAVASCLSGLLGAYVQRAALRQARLPGPLAGLGLRGVEATADVHMLARVRTTEQRVLAITGAVSFVDTAAATAAADRLRARWGVRVVGSSVELEAGTAAEVAAGPWHQQYVEKAAADRR